MKRLVLLLHLFVVLAPSYCQNFNYTYDNAGNRVSRNTVTLKSTKDAVNNEVFQEISAENSGESTIKIYPNPVRELLMVEITGERPEYLIQLFDFNGKQILSLQTSNSLTPISFADLISGTYILRISSGTEANEWKVIRE
ncbi:MAG: T9SS type A sorting domain-containing protein [Bacteroidales bacterium]